MLVTVFVGCLIPLIRNPNFYYWDDTAAAFMPMWQRIGGDILSGRSPFFQLDMWRGGNVLGEANTGLWNPVTLLLMIVTHPLDDVATGITIGKFVLFLIAAGGVFLLARNYGASPWMAAVAGAVFPLSGWVLYMNGTSWLNELAINAFAPWAWWAVRRAMQRGGRGWSIPVAAFCGYLTYSVGDPYGLLALAAVFLAVGVEVAVARRWRELWWLVLLGIGLVLLAVIIFLPFVLTSSVGFRADSGIGCVRPALPDVPRYVPRMVRVAGAALVAVAYPRGLEIARWRHRIRARLSPARARSKPVGDVPVARPSSSVPLPCSDHLPRGCYVEWDSTEQARTPMGFVRSYHARRRVAGILGHAPAMEMARIDHCAGRRLPLGFSQMGRCASPRICHPGGGEHCHARRSSGHRARKRERCRLQFSALPVGDDRAVLELSRTYSADCRFHGDGSQPGSG
jgi:hypothetical protein